jgi:hypothetical protein
MRAREAGRTIIMLAASVLLAACASGVGGGGTRDLEVVAFRADAAAAPADVAGRISQAGADIVLLSAERDSAWFAAVAAETRMQLSGPGTTGGVGLAFLTRLEMLGDTSLVLEVPDGGSVHMQDALYRVERNRLLDVMTVRFDAPDLRIAVRRLFDYLAHDVAAHVPVVLAIDAATPAQADSVAVLMRAYYSNELECPGSQIPAGTALPVRLLYGPSARISCRASRVIPGPSPAPAIRAVLGR